MAENKNEQTDSANNDPAELLPNEGDFVRLSVKDQKSLAEEILSPPEPTSALLRTKETYNRIRKAY